MAATTFGTNDVAYWGAFAFVVDHVGPIRVYGEQFVEPYNHMPLAGWMLVLFNGLTGLGPDLGFWIRLTASLADVVTAYLVWQLVRQYRTDREASFAAAAVAASPLMIVVSGFHGNTDPVFVMLVLMAVYLLQLRGRPLGAGLAFGIAISLKLTPVVVLPWLLFLAVRQGRATWSGSSAPAPWSSSWSGSRC